MARCPYQGTARLWATTAASTGWARGDVGCVKRTNPHAVTGAGASHAPYKLSRSARSTAKA
jgi:hypothetical protein